MKLGRILVAHANTYVHIYQFYEIYLCSCGQKTKVRKCNFAPLEYEKMLMAQNQGQNIFFKLHWKKMLVQYTEIPVEPSEQEGGSKIRSPPPRF